MTEREKERMINDLKKMEIDFDCDSYLGFNYAINKVIDYIESIEVEETENE